jgi:hypothetical protein
LDQNDLTIALPDLESIEECVAKVVPEFFCASHGAANTSRYFVDRLSDQVGARHPTLVANGDAGNHQVVRPDAKVRVVLSTFPILRPFFFESILNQRIKISILEKVTYSEACQRIREIQNIQVKDPEIRSGMNNPWPAGRAEFSLG